jgi:hypothetical protein
MTITSTTTLLTNVTVTAPQTSPAVKLQGSDQYWTATLNTTAHAGTETDFTIQSSATNHGPWTDVSNNVLQGADGTGKFGNDLSNQIQDFTLFGTGPFWRMNITNVVGSILINSLTVNNGN